jgi:Transcription initiation factor IID, 18kD subunit
VRGKVDEGDICFVLRKDPRKAARALELLTAVKENKKYKSYVKTDAFDIDDVKEMLNVNQGDGGGGDGEAGPSHTRPGSAAAGTLGEDGYGEGEEEVL